MPDKQNTPMLMLSLYEPLPIEEWMYRQRNGFNNRLSLRLAIRPGRQDEESAGLPAAQ